MEVLLLLYLIMKIAGYLLPDPGFVLAARDWQETRRDAPTDGIARRYVTHIALVLLVLGLILWTYGVIREIGADYSYNALTATVGRWGSPGLIIVSAFAERGPRKHLIIGAIGVFLYFSSSIGEWI